MKGEGLIQEIKTIAAGSWQQKEQALVDRPIATDKIPIDRKLKGNFPESGDFTVGQLPDRRTKPEKQRLVSRSTADQGKTVHKSVVLKSRVKVCARWLPRYFRYSIEAKRVESTKMGNDKSFHGMFTCVLKFLQHFKESKENKTKNEKRRVR